MYVDVGVGVEWALRFRGQPTGYLLLQDTLYPRMASQSGVSAMTGCRLGQQSGCLVRGRRRRGRGSGKEGKSDPRRTFGAARRPRMLNLAVCKVGRSSSARWSAGLLGW
jgi:hypothetical protein